jgi:hypothetical protein
MLRSGYVFEAKDVPDYPLEVYLAMVNDPAFYKQDSEEQNNYR